MNTFELIKQDNTLLKVLEDSIADYYSLQKYSNLQTQCTWLLQLFPEHQMALLFRAIASNKLGQYHQAIRDCDQLLKLAPNYSDALWIRAQSKYDKGQFQAAELDCQNVLDQEKYHIDVVLLSASIKLVLAKPIEALDLCSQLIKIKAELEKKDFLKALKLQGIALYRLGRLVKAERNFHKILKSSPNKLEALRYYAMIKRDQGEYAVSEAICDRYLTEKPDEIDIRMLCVFNRYKQNKLDEASQDCDQIQAIIPDSIFAIGLKAHIDYQRQNYDNAAVLITIALSITDQSDRHHNPAYICVDSNYISDLKLLKAKTLNAKGEVRQARILCHELLSDDYNHDCAAKLLTSIELQTVVSLGLFGSANKRNFSDLEINTLDNRESERKKYQPESEQPSTSFSLL